MFFNMQNSNFWGAPESKRTGFVLFYTALCVSFSFDVGKVDVSVVVTKKFEKLAIEDTWSVSFLR